ncbi:hypothetical protein GCM10022261_01040 [Brevibacterium daeguense]|uniref:DUF202 domain-containing protein n=1 Tax=Brevibacterium daeguense TaxID=909936 RepID=A0ABP8EF16_9MICO|nr:hypothetical protein [Brevibacterium daeguense]
MSSSHTQAPVVAGQAPALAAPASVPVRFRSDRAADRLMRRILGVRNVDLRSGEGAHRTFRTSVVISALRCLITYVVIPILVPILSLAGWVAAPVGLALCLVAAINGVISLQRFWRADHSHRWTYTVFICAVFAILAVSTVTELGRLGVTP